MTNAAAEGAGRAQPLPLAPPNRARVVSKNPLQSTAFQRDEAGRGRRFVRQSSVSGWLVAGSRVLTARREPG
jgi:hypothetical protein